MIKSNPTAGLDAGQKRGRISLQRIVPVAALVLGAIAFFALGLDAYVTLEALREHRTLLTTFVAENAVAAPLLFMTIYAVAIAFSLPGGAVMTIAGGFLFGNFLGTGMVVIAATVGATVLFVIAKTSVGDPLRAKAGPWMKRLEGGFQENALSYLLVLRLIPLFPFFVVNLVPAFLGVSLRTYVVGTFAGIIPGTFVYASVGAGLGSLVDKQMKMGEPFSPAQVLTPQIVTALVGLAVLALLPIAYKKIKARRS